MAVLVDTPIWSLALRRNPGKLNILEENYTAALRELIQDGHAQLIGPVRQELLSGIRHEKVFRGLRDHLRAFDEPVLESGDHEEAAHIDNLCRARGIAASAIDLLICAVAMGRSWQVFTTDHDFTRYAKIVPLKLYKVN
ncbi:MAG: PIN domain-containing protein [Candidatus Sulfotelmatobacter sp.]|jgi:predicted nucleic acid-binding protein